MWNMREESEKYPFKLVEQSTLMISPSFKTMSEDGIPWQTSSLMEVHTLFGKPSKFRGAGSAPYFMV